MVTDEYLAIVRSSLAPVRFLIRAAEKLLFVPLVDVGQDPAEYLECFLLAGQVEERPGKWFPLKNGLLIGSTEFEDLNPDFRREKVGNWLLEADDGSLRMCDFLIQKRSDGREMLFVPNRFPKELRVVPPEIEFVDVF